jgi:monothiol glutaredoxin
MADGRPGVTQLTAPELKAMIERGERFAFFDVRTEQEHAIARIEGARLLDRAGYEHLLTLDRATPVVFHCHHGVRSQSAAEYCLHELGFTTLYNLSGGIDAWSCCVDSSVPRY